MHLIGNGLLALMQYPDPMALLRREPAPLDTAIDELLRYESSVQMTSRYALEEMTFGDKLLRQGEMVAIVIGAADRDPAQFPAADAFDVTPTPNRRLSLGMGIHYCIGGPLARAETRLAFTGLLQRLPNLRLADSE